MTNKIYRSAMGKQIDLGALLLQNETVRAVGNMNVNARGDTLDSNNKVIDTKNRQVQRQYAKQVSPMSAQKPPTSNRAARQLQEKVETVESVAVSEYASDVVDAEDTFADLPMDNEVEAVEAEANTQSDSIKGGLAGAIARSRVVQQEKEKSLREQQQSQGVRRI